MPVPEVGVSTPDPVAHLEIRVGNDIQRVRLGLRQDDELVWLTPELT